MRAPVSRTVVPDLNKLRTFAVVAEHESYSRAAEELLISQPALSVQVRDLERHYEMALFERAGRGVRLTEAGEVVRGYARRILALAEESGEAVSELQGLHAGLLRLGASTTIGEYLLPAALAAFHHAYPGIRVSVEIANTLRITDRLLHGELHLGLIGEPLQNPGLEVEPYLDDRIILVLPPGHRWAGARITVQDLSLETLIVREQGSATRDVTERALTAAGARMEIEMELGGTEAVKGAVAAGLGVAFVSASTVKQELESGRLSTSTVRGLNIHRQFQLARRRGRRLSAAEEAFIPLLRSESTR